MRDLPFVQIAPQVPTMQISQRRKLAWAQVLTATPRNMIHINNKQAPKVVCMLAGDPDLLSKIRS